MTFQHSYKRILSNLILGILFFIMGILRIFEGTAEVFNYFQLLLGLVMIAVFAFEAYFPYLKIEDGIITKNTLRKKSISLSEIKRIRKFAGDITLYSDEEKIKIHTELIRKHQKEELDEFLQSLHIDIEESSSKPAKNNR